MQRPEDLAEARKLIQGKAALMAKIEKPAAIERLEEIVEMCDGVMVARGDLGVELPPQSVPPLQKRIVETARRMGRPVVVATQMLESMIKSPSPTRAEVSDVATAIYDGADAIMLSAESAAGDWPVESVAMMNAIGDAVERDPMHGDRIHFTVTRPDPTTADALAEAAGNIAETIGASAIICFTTSGSTARRIARERPGVPLLVLTPKIETARRLGLLWGTHNVHTRDVESFEEMVAKAKRIALRQNIAKGGDSVIVMAGVPFRTPGSTNVLHVVRIVGDELKGYATPVERAGYLQSFLFRAARLVVDTGIHTKKWTREQATDYFVNTVGFARGRAQREIERYCVSPGQACSYKIGHAAWLRARENAQKIAGAKFDLKKFHDVLEAGAVPLTLLEQMVEERAKSW